MAGLGEAWPGTAWRGRALVRPGLVWQGGARQGTLHKLPRLGTAGHRTVWQGRAVARLGRAWRSKAGYPPQSFSRQGKAQRGTGTASQGVARLGRVGQGHIPHTSFRGVARLGRPRPGAVGLGRGTAHDFPLRSAARSARAATAPPACEAMLAQIDIRAIQKTLSRHQSNVGMISAVHIAVSVQCNRSQCFACTVAPWMAKSGPGQG